MQISIGVVGLIMTGVGFIVTPVVAYFSGQTATAKEISAVSERTAKLETIVPTIKEDTDEIKEDIRDIKKAFNIK
jgi:hypothetical protein